MTSLSFANLNAASTCNSLTGSTILSTCIAVSSACLFKPLRISLACSFCRSAASVAFSAREVRSSCRVASTRVRKASDWVERVSLVLRMLECEAVREERVVSMEVREVARFCKAAGGERWEQGERI